MPLDYDIEREINKIFKYKVELHVHLDGAVRPETVIDIARTNGRKINAADVESLKEECVLKNPESLASFLKCFGSFMPAIVGDREAVSRIAYEFCEDCAKQNIRYVEVRYCPHTLCNPFVNGNVPEGGLFTPRDVVQTICDTLARGAKDFNIRVNSILCCLTHKPEWSAEIVELCKDFRDQGVVAIDSAGLDFVPGMDPATCRHKQAFYEAYKNGIHRTVHAGENGPAEGVREALDHMFAERIGHGYHIIDDPELYERCKNEGVHLEVCPISSIRTGACPKEISKHPLLRFLKDGMKFSLNSDDPIILDNTLTEDYILVREMGLSNDDIVKSIFNAARASFAPDEMKKVILNELEEVYGPH